MSNKWLCPFIYNKIYKSMTKEWIIPKEKQAKKSNKNFSEKETQSLHIRPSFNLPLYLNAEHHKLACIVKSKTNAE